MKIIQIITTKQEIQEVISHAVENAMKDFKENFAEKMLEEDKKFNIEEVAEYLKVTKPTIHSYKNRGIIPFHQVGKTVYFKKSEIDKAFSNKPKGGTSC